MLRLILLLTGLCTSLSAASAQDPRTTDPRFIQCLIWLMDGYPSGIEEWDCGGNYQLPSPYHFSCASALKYGFDNPTQREACALFFEQQAERARTSYTRGD